MVSSYYDYHDELFILININLLVNPSITGVSDNTLAVSLFCVICYRIPTGPLNHFIAIEVLQMLGFTHKFTWGLVCSASARNIHFLRIYKGVHLILKLGANKLCRLRIITQGQPQIS